MLILCKTQWYTNIENEFQISTLKRQVYDNFNGCDYHELCSWTSSLQLTDHEAEIKFSGRMLLGFFVTLEAITSPWFVN